MSMRRPRIKAAAILPPKRPARDGSAAATAPKQLKTEIKSEPPAEQIIESKQPNEEKVQLNVLESTDKPDCEPDKPVDNTATTAKPVDKLEEILTPQEHIDLNDNDIFKSPPMVANQKRTESFSTSDIESDKLEDFYQKNTQGPPSPVKVRQRIRPTPFFGMRRNSLQGYGSDMEDEPRRQRHTSTSSSTGPLTPQRIRPPNIQRIRTESSCSNMSEFGREQNAKTPRKIKEEDNSRTYVPRKDIWVRFRCKVIEKASMKMSDLIYYNPTTNPMVAADPPPSTSTEEKPKAEIIAKPLPETPVEPKEKETCMPVPQLKLGPDGEMILDEQSLVIETTAEKEARETLANTKVIYMDEFSGNSGFYRRNKRTRDWPPEETIKFYKCLHTVGTDFSLMLTLFPNRTRRDLKLKFKKEEKTNLALVNKALLFPKTFNIVELKEELDKEQKELDAKRKELEEIYRKKAQVTSKKKFKQYNLYTSRSGNVLKGGDLIYDNEVVSPLSKEANELKPIKKERKKSAKQKKEATKNKGGEDVTAKDKDNKKNNKKQKEKKETIEKESELTEKVKKEYKGKKSNKKDNIQIDCRDEIREANTEYEEVNETADSQHKVELPFEEEDINPAFSYSNTINSENNIEYNMSQVVQNIQMPNGETVLLEFTTEPITSTKIENYKIINYSDLIPNEDLSLLNNSEGTFNPKLEDDESLSVYDTVEVINSDMNDSLEGDQLESPQVETVSPQSEVCESPITPTYQPQVPILSEIPNAVDLILSNSLLYTDTTQSTDKFKTKTEFIAEDDLYGNESYDYTPPYEGSTYENESFNQNEDENSSNSFVKKENGANVDHGENDVEGNLDNLEQVTIFYKSDNQEDEHCSKDRGEQREEKGEQRLEEEGEQQPEEESEKRLEEKGEHCAKGANEYVKDVAEHIVEEATEYELKEANEINVKEANEVNVKETNEVNVKEANEVNVKETNEVNVKETNEVNVKEANESHVEKDEEQHIEAQQCVEVVATNSNNEAHDAEDERNVESAKEIDAEMERFMHNDLGAILTNLINGSLVVVSMEDEHIPDKIVNEIYIMNKETGCLSDTPLDLPEDIVNCIVEELNAS